VWDYTIWELMDTNVSKLWPDSASMERARVDTFGEGYRTVFDELKRMDNMPNCRYMLVALVRDLGFDSVMRFYSTRLASLWFEGEGSVPHQAERGPPDEGVHDRFANVEGVSGFRFHHTRSRELPGIRGEGVRGCITSLPGL
jgi:hypothetical protein